MQHVACNKVAPLRIYISRVSTDTHPVKLAARRATMKCVFLRLITAIVLLDAVKGVPDQSPYIPAGERLLTCVC